MNEVKRITEQVMMGIEGNDAEARAQRHIEALDIVREVNEQADAAYWAAAAAKDPQEPGIEVPEIARLAMVHRGDIRAVVHAPTFDLAVHWITDYAIPEAAADVAALVVAVRAELSTRTGQDMATPPASTAAPETATRPAARLRTASGEEPPF